jgi:restriction endonuclease S subunit
MKEKINIKFYYFFFKELRDALIEDLTRGAAKKSIGKTTLSSLAIPFPPLDHQNYAVELIESNNNEIAEHNFSISEYEEKISDLKELNRQHISL